jgi:hypothetical protein
LPITTIDDLVRDGFDVGTRDRASRRVQDEVADPHRSGLRIDDLDRAESVERLRGDLRRLHRGR